MMQFTHFQAAAAFRGRGVVMLASRVTIANFTSNATRRVVGQWGGAGGAGCEDHFGVDGASTGSSRASIVLREFASVLRSLAKQAPHSLVRE